MTSENPYSKKWRDRTRARMAALAIDNDAVAVGTGLRKIAVHDALCWDITISLEVSGSIDELLDRLEHERSEGSPAACVEDDITAPIDIDASPVDRRSGRELVASEDFDRDLGAEGDEP